MDSFKDLLAAWTPQELADLLGVPYASAQSMRYRGRVAPHYWSRLIDAAGNKGLTISADMLTQFAFESKGRSPRLTGANGLVQNSDEVDAA